LIQGALASGADALGVAGGDGSLAVVAAAAAASRIPFVCIPAGTRNHFARDVGVAPNDLVARSTRSALRWNGRSTSAT
jgi:diacylglycerol kinase family enzyme